VNKEDRGNNQGNKCGYLDQEVGDRSLTKERRHANQRRVSLKLQDLSPLQTTKKRPKICNQSWKRILEARGRRRDSTSYHVDGFLLVSIFLVLLPRVGAYNGDRRTATKVEKKIRGWWDSERCSERAIW
jgi:hypothetical protein